MSTHTYAFHTVFEFVFRSLFPRFPSLSSVIIQISYSCSLLAACCAVEQESEEGIFSCCFCCCCCLMLVCADFMFICFAKRERERNVLVRDLCWSQEKRKYRSSVRSSNDPPQPRDVLRQDPACFVFCCCNFLVHYRTTSQFHSENRNTPVSPSSLLVVCVCLGILVI